MKINNSLYVIPFFLFLGMCTFQEKPQQVQQEEKKDTIIEEEIDEEVPDSYGPYAHRNTILPRISVDTTHMSYFRELDVFTLQGIHPLHKDNLTYPCVGRLQKQDSIFIQVFYNTGSRLPKLYIQKAPDCFFYYEGIYLPDGCSIIYRIFRKDYILTMDYTIDQDDTTKVNARRVSKFTILSEKKAQFIDYYAAFNQHVIPNCNFNFEAIDMPLHGEKYTKTYYVVPKGIIMTARPHEGYQGEPYENYDTRDDRKEPKTKLSPFWDFVF